MRRVSTNGRIGVAAGRQITDAGGAPCCCGGGTPGIGCCMAHHHPDHPEPPPYSVSMPASAGCLPDDFLCCHGQDVIYTLSGSLLWSWTESNLVQWIVSGLRWRLQMQRRDALDPDSCNMHSMACTDPPGQDELWCRGVITVLGGTGTLITDDGGNQCSTTAPFTQSAWPFLCASSPDHWGIGRLFALRDSTRNWFAQEHPCPFFGAGPQFPPTSWRYSESCFGSEDAPGTIWGQCSWFGLVSCETCAHTGHGEGQGNGRLVDDSWTLEAQVLAGCDALCEDCAADTPTRPDLISTGPGGAFDLL